MNINERSKRLFKIIIPVTAVLLISVIAAILFTLQPNADSADLKNPAEKTGSVSEETSVTKEENSKTENTESQSSNNPASSSKADENNSSVQANAGSSNNLSVKADTGKTSDRNNSSQSDTAHKHVWHEHTVKQWVSNPVTVPDYKETTVYGARFYILENDGSYIAKGPTYWFENGFTKDDLKAIIYEGIKNADENGLYNGVYYGNYQNVQKTELVRSGSHQEDHGYYKSVVDYLYCDCGARK